MAPVTGVQQRAKFPRRPTWSVFPAGIVGSGIMPRVRLRADGSAMRRSRSKRKRLNAGVGPSRGRGREQCAISARDVQLCWTPPCTHQPAPLDQESGLLATKQDAAFVSSTALSASDPAGAVEERHWPRKHIEFPTVNGQIMIASAWCIARRLNGLRMINGLPPN
jgi:hypothetical protein